MSNNDYLFPGIAAIAVALLFPGYWIYEVTIADFSASFADYGAGAGILNWLFLVIGVLSTYVYYSLKQILHDHHNYRGADIVLTLMISVCVVFFLGMFAVGALAPWFGDSYNDLTLMLLWIGSLVLFGVLDLLLAAMLLRDGKELPDLIRAFAIVNLMLGLFEITVIFSFAAIFLYPIACLILAVHFLRKPEMIEII